MAVALRIAPLARKDVIEIACYIAEDSSDAAERFLDAVEASCSEIARMPELGTLCRFSNPEASSVRVRTISGFENHLIFYRPDDGEVLVVRILHGSRNWQTLFEE